MSSNDAKEQVAALSAAVAAVFESLAAGAAWRVGEADLLQLTGSLARLRSGVEAAYLRSVAEVERRRTAGPVTGSTAGSTARKDGPHGAGTGIGASTESFLRTSAPLTATQARGDVAAARALAPGGALDGLEQQLACGDITRAHVDLAVRCLDRIPVQKRSSEQDRTTIAEYFATLAPTGNARHLRTAAAGLLERLAPEVADRFDPQSHTRRFLDMTIDSTGMLVGHFALDPTAGATFQAAVDAASAPRPSEDGARDERTARERRADALLSIADTSLGVTGPVRGERPRVVVHTTPEQLAGLVGSGPARTDAGTDLGPGALRRTACDAVLQRVVWDRDGTVLATVPLELGRTARLADLNQRRALAVRDRGCIIPGCGAPPAHCDAHHVQHWADGGPTDLCNLCLLCASHHTAVHEGVWIIRMGADGIPEVIPPDRVDPRRRPRRAPHHDLDILLEALTARTRPDVVRGRDGPRAAGRPDDPDSPDAPGHSDDSDGLRAGVPENPDDPRARAPRDPDGDWSRDWGPWSSWQLQSPTTLRAESGSPPF
jgi:hypothetical protein